MKQFIEKHQLVLFFTFSAILGYAPWLITGEPTWFIYGMPIAGITITFITKGMPGIKEQLKSAVNIKASILECLKIVFLLVSINSLTLIVSYFLFNDIPSFAMLRTEPLLVPLFLLAVLLGGPIVEEVFGLRGYALPVLLKTKSPLTSSIVVGTFFGTWHLVEFFRPGSTQYAIGLGYYPLFIIAEIASSILMTYFYIKNKNNLFLAGVFFHWMMNIFAVLFQTDVTFSGIENAPKMNTHYFVIYSVILSLTSIYVVVNKKMYLPVAQT